MKRSLALYQVIYIAIIASFCSFAGPPKPTIEGPQVITVDMPVQFNGNCKDCKDAVKSWDWNFDEADQPHGNVQQPTFTFTKPGQHVITLVINGDANQSVQMVVDVKAQSPLKPELIPESVGPPVDKNKELKLAIQLFLQHKEFDVDGIKQYLKGVSLQLPIVVDSKPTTLESYLKQSRTSKDKVKNIEFKVDPKTQDIVGMDIQTSN